MSDERPAERSVPAALEPVEAGFADSAAYPTPEEYPGAPPPASQYPGSSYQTPPYSGGQTPPYPANPYAGPYQSPQYPANPYASPYQTPQYSARATTGYPGAPAQTWGPPAPGTQASGAGHPGYAGYQGHPGYQGYPGAPQQWTTAPPPALAGRPQTPPPSGRGWLVALVTVVGVVLLGLVVMFVVPSGTGLTVPGLKPSATPTAKGTSSPTPGRTPSPKPTATMPTDQKVLLRNNPIYALKVPAKCPDQGRPSTKAAFQAQVKALMDCENAAWKKALAATPVEFSKPKVEFYGSKTKSACGTLGSTFPAAYCSADKTMYFSTGSYQQGRYYRLAVAQFVMHEYAHHVQQLADITPSSVALRESDALTSRRIELQAHCMAHYQLTHSDLGFDSLDRSDAEYQFGYTNDPKGHGSAKAERYWGRRGMDGTTIGACNTWNVKPSKVT